MLDVLFDCLCVVLVVLFPFVGGCFDVVWSFPCFGLWVFRVLVFCLCVGPPPFVSFVRAFVVFVFWWCMGVSIAVCFFCCFCVCAVFFVCVVSVWGVFLLCLCLL